jgi:hypothetical protein
LAGRCASEAGSGHYLASKTGLAAPQIEQIAESQRQAGDDAVLAGAFYAMLREAGTTDPSAVFALDRSRLERALDDAQNRNLIPGLAEADRKRILDEELPRMQVAELLRPADEGQPASLGDLLGGALVDPDLDRLREKRDRYTALPECAKRSTGSGIRYVKNLSSAIRMRCWAWSWRWSSAR